MSKKYHILASVLFSLGVLSGCNNPTSSKTNSLPPTLRDGYTVEYDGFKSQVHNVKSKDNGARIYGKLFTPNDFDKTKEYPILIMSHGYNSISMNGDDGVVQSVLKKGMLCYTFDFRGGGKMSQSVGKTTEMSVLTEVSDLESVIDDITALSFTDDNKIALFGHSFGGLVTALTSGLNPSKVSAVVLHAPATSYDVKSLYSSKEEIEALPDTPIKNQNMEVSKKFFLDLWDLDIFNTMVKWNKEVLLMCGDQDGGYQGVVKTTEYYNSHSCPATLYTIEGAEHSFRASEYFSVMPDVFSYLTRMGVLTD